ncbi:uncharacterized protein KD926_002816 [Aspergillus affinis]|uniref:uncharacterized protein n=1 Tax=Aspergillus affinis TaxID=1070780 RepID=UPI0022FEEDA3|nr:uncharacterized protein KD926_002816 [Aspergillus affinis]KAI9035884.1 hypothetical protein KD926_002816 [Aspergillus affinis]
MSSPDLSPVGVKLALKGGKRAVSSTSTIAVAPENDFLPPPARGLTASAVSKEFDPSVGAKPSSPFYRHATPSVSMAKFKAHTKSNVAENGYDLENNLLDPRQASMGEDECNRQSKLWVQEKRRCGCMRSLSKKQRLALKAVIAIGTLGSMIAIALGITAAVGGGVWRSDHQHRVIGQER